MATVLAAQLAQIRAQSINSIDLKAQKKAHSQSLLFVSRDAAVQDFDSIYQICYEGFDELCRIDPRFVQFANNIFSEQSKQEDRTQMTAIQNQQLDVAIEEFLSLVGSKIPLKPALKAVEWMVRRFRIQENNTLTLVLTLLPYHTSAIFPTLLSILPKNSVPTLKFLHPYMQSLVSPPRQTIVHAASHNRPFFTALTTQVLKTGRMGYQYPLLTSFWASVATEAVAAMLDQALSARRESQKQSQEDVVVFLLPILNEGLSLDQAPDLQVGCYMVLTVLASKVDLDDGILKALMEAVTFKWNQTSHAGLICLSVLAQQRNSVKLPRKVFEAIIALEGLDDDLSVLRKQYKVDKLVLGVILGIVTELKNAPDATRLHPLRKLMEASLMDEASTVAAIKSILFTAQNLRSETASTYDIQGSMTDLLLRLADSSSVGKLVRATIKDPEHDTGHLKLRLQRVIGEIESSRDRLAHDMFLGSTSNQTVTEGFDALTSRIPTRTAYEISFLSHSDSYIFGSLAGTFSSICNSDIDIEKFSDLPVLRKSLATSEPLFLSFFIRLWCSNGPTNTRVAAIQIVSRYIRKGSLKADVQILLPYLIHALADRSAKVRHAATGLLLGLERAYAEAEADIQPADLLTLGREQIYGQGRETERLSWLSMSESRKLMASILIPGVEECLFDRDHVSRLLSDMLNGSKHNISTHKDLKTSLRLAIFNFLGSHVVNTPLYTVKQSLLQILNEVTKVSSTSRTRLLLPLLSSCAEKSQEELELTCRKEQLDPLPFLDQIVNTVIPSDQDGIQTLKKVVEFGDRSSFPSLRTAALHRFQAIWLSMRPDLQTSVASVLLEQALNETGGETIATIRALPLSTSILQIFVESLPSISSTKTDKPPAFKRRRTGHYNPTETAPDRKSLSVAIKHITLVLELVGADEIERHSGLLKGLFDVMSDLQYHQSLAKAATDYLLLLTIDSMLAIVKRAEGTSGSEIDHAMIRTDVIVDCVRTATSPQVRNAALLLISALATVVPELVLHSVMPIFTFMGSNTLRQDDDFSAYVVKQTVESIVPRLVQSLYRRKEGPFVGISELLLSFAAAFEHIPIQRRIDLFTCLIDKVGSSDYLFALLAILMDKYPGDQRVVKFATDLTSRYDVKIRLRTMENYLKVILDARNSKPTFSTSLLMMKEDLSVESAVANLLQLPTAILGDPILVSIMRQKLKEESEDAIFVRKWYTQILEDIFSLAEQSKGSRTLSISCMRILDASLSLPPIEEVIDTLKNLLACTNDSIRRQALRSFEYRLSDAKIDNQATQTACLAFLPRLLSIIKESRDVPLIHLAIGCVDKISEVFGKKDVSAVIESAKTISSDICLGAAESSIRVTALICLATMVEVSADAFISIVPHALAKAMDILADSIRENSKDSILHNTVYTFLSALLHYLPWVVTGAELDRLLKLSYESANAEMGEECDQRRIDALHLLPRTLEAKECFAALKRTWTDAVTEGPMAVKEYLQVSRLAIDHHPKSVIVRRSEALGNLLLSMFDLRRMQLSRPIGDTYTVDKIEEVEDGVNDFAIAMVYKLNDAAFRPLFSRMLEWTTLSDLNHGLKTGKEAIMHRQASWYKFLLRFFDTLKSIVTSYAGFIVQDAVEILKTSSLEDEACMFLWRQVVLTLHKTFEHDQDDFYRPPNHFSPISAALLSQLNNAAQIPLLPELIPAIAELAVATDFEAHHKEMNTAILQYMRSDNPAVRLAAIQCQRALTERLGDEWVANVHEMLPFISEAMEDDDEAVEREVQRWKSDMENVLGEPLDPMLH